LWLSSDAEVDYAQIPFQASYTAERAKGLLKDGGSKRRAALEEGTKGLGVKLEAFY
jgi:hypothetical protein